jgi:hypothetical protein
MAIALDPKQIVLNDELLLSQVVSQEAIVRLLIDKGVLSKEEFLEMVGGIGTCRGKAKEHHRKEVWQ